MRFQNVFFCGKKSLFSLISSAEVDISLNQCSKILGTSLEVLPHDRLSKKGINPAYINGWWNACSVKKTPLVFYQFLSRGRYLQNRSLYSYTKRSHSSTAKRWIWPGLPREIAPRVVSLDYISKSYLSGLFGLNLPFSHSSFNLKTQKW